MKRLRKAVARTDKYVRIFLHYCRNLTLKKTSKKTVVICFDGIFPHGGFVDRLKGIVSFYEAAKNYGYDFYIHFEHPFQLDTFLVPNQVNWKCTKAMCSFNPFDTKVLYLMDNFNANPINLIQNPKFTKFIVYCNIDHLPKIYPNLDRDALSQKWSVAFHELFKKTYFLTNALQKLPLPPYVVFHSRFTSLMGDFQDTTSIQLSDLERVDLKNRLIENIETAAKKFKHNDIFVLSDSVIFLNHIKHNTSFKVLDGVPKHSGIEKNGSSEESHLKTITDFFFIASADRVFLLKSGKMYNSGFSRYAAILGQKPFQIIE